MVKVELAADEMEFISGGYNVSQLSPSELQTLTNLAREVTCLKAAAVKDPAYESQCRQAEKRLKNYEAILHNKYD